MKVKPASAVYKFKNHNHQNGFTLIELLVAISILGIIGTATISVLFATLRAGKKSDTLVSLRQNGNAVVSQVAKNIRYAKSLDTPSACVPFAITSSIAVTSYTDNTQTVFACSGGAAPAITSNSAVLTDTSTTIVSDCSFTCTQSTINDPPTIHFKFKLHAKASGHDTSGLIPFQTSVTMRNYNK